eukprot:scaffold6621_cov133-Skeletonema_menzelii.AAC.3
MLCCCQRAWRDSLSLSRSFDSVQELSSSTLVGERRIFLFLFSRRCDFYHREPPQPLIETIQFDVIWPLRLPAIPPSKSQSSPAAIRPMQYSISYWLRLSEFLSGQGYLR